MTIKIPNLQRTVDTFNKSYESFTQANVEYNNESRHDDYESNLTGAANEVGIALESAIKVYLRNIVYRQLSSDDRDALKKNLNFNILLNLLQKYADPEVSEQVEINMRASRDIRNISSHEKRVTPNHSAVEDAIDCVRNFFHMYLPVEGSDKLRINGASGKSTFIEFDEATQPTPPIIKKIKQKYKLTSTTRQNLYFLWLAFSPDGRTLAASGGGAVQFWDVTSGYEVKHIEISMGLGCNSIQYSPNGLFFAVGSECRISLWHTPTLSRIYEVRSENVAHATTLQFSPDGQNIIVSGDQSSWNRGAQVVLLDASTGQIVEEFPTIKANAFSQQIKFSPDGRCLIVLNQNKGYIWDIEKRCKRHIFQDPSGEFTAVVFSPDGGRLVLGTNKGKIIVVTMDNIKNRDAYIHFQSNLKCIVGLDFHPIYEVVLIADSNDISIWTIYGKPLRDHSII